VDHPPDAASRRGFDRGGRTTDVDAHEPDRIGDLTARPSGDRGKIEDTVRITLTQCDFQALSIADVPHDLLEPARKAGERPLGMFRNRKKIEADDALSTHQQRFRHCQTNKARRPRDKSSHRIRPLCETACPNR
jgi:hypothetical protein